jgi:hypothetical protein
MQIKDPRNQNTGGGWYKHSEKFKYYQLPNL